jgi:hypothetical protein
MVHKLKLKSEDCPNSKNFHETLQAKMDIDETIAQHLAFNDRAAFQTSGQVNRH